MSSNQIVVPLRIEAKYLEHDTQVTPPLADFSKLPWNDGTSDQNFDQPYVSDGIVHEPFETGLILGKGLHLHFVLPHFLGKQYENTAGTHKTMPAAPNRWLITKIGGTAPNQWLVQSDYVYDPSEKPAEPTCIIPSTGAPPYRHMGKKIQFANAKTADPTFTNSFKKQNSKHNPLTVVGYGDVNFSSFYPNCMGVFGFHDSDLLPASDGTVTYQIVGWVSEDEDDFVSQTVKDLKNKILAPPPKKDKSAPAPTTAQLVEEFQKELKRICGIELDGISNLSDIDLGGGTVYYARMEVQISGGAVTTNNDAQPTLNLALGNTGTEALAALLADQLANKGADIIETSTVSNPKKTIEDQLESILMLSKIDHLKTDVGPKFQEARHEKGFNASHSGHLWKVKSKTANPKFSHNGDPTTVNTKQSTMPPLPKEVAVLLNDLNMAQVAYDKAAHEVATFREQLYLDWVKYMHARYPMVEGRGEFPDADHIQYFLKNYSFPELEQLVATTGQITLDKTVDEHPEPKTSSPSGTMADQLVTAWNSLHSFLTNYNQNRPSTDQPELFMIQIAGPRFWEAKAPVVLFSGLPAENTPSSTLQCQLTPVCFTLPYPNQTLPDISGTYTALATGDYLYNLANQKWNPFILDWAVDLIDTSLRDSKGGFEALGLENNFVFNTANPDFQKATNYNSGNLSVFSGSVLMSGHAKPGILKNIEKFFEATFLKYKITFQSGKSYTNFFQGAISLAGVANTTAASTYWTQSIGVLDMDSSEASSSDFMEKSGKADLTNPYFTAWAAYGQLSSDQVLSQTLDGFNEACIMKKKAPQFPIDEPIGFDYEKYFTTKVKGHVQNQRHSSPVMAFEFNPIRSGGFSLDMLSLIDNFGIAHKIDTTTAKPVTSETLKDHDGKTFLNPRLSQPARLNLRWHAANPVNGNPDLAGMDTNDSPETSPICGWLMVNYINNEIAVYDADGSALGYLSWPHKPKPGTNLHGTTGEEYSPITKGQWNTVPWSNQICQLETNISNPHLQALVQHLRDTTNTANGATTCFLDDFRTTTQHALDNISPASANIYNIKSILMGRPMAVVRSRVSYELKGKPVISQSWSSLLTDLSNCNAQPSWTYDNRNQDNWTNVQLPCMLGEYRQLNDGLVGYWVEGADGGLGPTLFSSEMKSSDVTDSAIKGLKNTVFPTQWISPTDAPLNMTMLMDPRGLLHATTGLLPTKAISIPPEHYISAMQKIEMWFKTAPILQQASSDNKTVPLHVPSIPGYKWQWWDAFQGLKKVSKVDHASHDHDASKMIEGWLSLVPDENEFK